MRRSTFTDLKHPIALIFTGSVFLVANVLGAEALFDEAKVRKEIEVMKSILATSLSFSSQEMEKLTTSGWGREYRRALREWSGGLRPRVEGLYLYGQGTVFTIHVPRLSQGGFDRIEALDAELAELEELDWVNADLLEARIALMESQLQLAQESLGPAGTGAYAPMPESVPLPPVPPEPPTAGERDERLPREERERREARAEDAKHRVREVREELQAARAEVQATQEDIEAYRRRLKNDLIEALARHGDSLTHVKPDEYVNFVLVESWHPVYDWEGGPQEGHALILSVQMSDILAHARGQLTFEQFAAQVLDY
jgi:hypothetical protein